MITLTSDVSLLALLSIFWLRHKPWMLPVTEGLMALLTKGDHWPPRPGHEPTWLFTPCLPEIHPMAMLFLTFLVPNSPKDAVFHSVLQFSTWSWQDFFSAGKMPWVLGPCEGATVWFPGMVSSCSSLAVEGSCANPPFLLTSYHYL